jgi:hypothetical protein
MIIGLGIFAGVAVLCIVGFVAAGKRRRHYEQTGEID